MKTRLTAISLLLVLLSSVIFAQGAQEDKKLSEMNLEDLLNMDVTTASKKAEKTSDAPGIMTTITAEEIKYFGANSIKDVLERVTSLQPMSSNMFPNNLSIMRGDLRTQYDNHVLILIDGRPIRDGVLGGANSPVYTGFPVDMIERIEIVRGPGSVLYGSNAFAGVINIITRGEEKKSSLNVHATAGSFGTMLGSVTGTIVKEDLKVKLSTLFENIDGWDYNAVTVRPGSPNLTINRKYGQKNIGLAADVDYKGLTFSGFYSNNKHDMTGIIPYATYAGKNIYDKLFLNLGYTYKFGETWEATANVTNTTERLTLDDEAAAVSADKHNSYDYLGEITVGGELTKNLNIIIGGVIDSRNKTDIGPTDAIKTPYHLTQLSTYFQADYRPIEELKLILGAQMNKPENKSWDVVPRFGAIFNLTSEFGIKTLYGQAFRSPWPSELLLVNPTVVGNPNLDPEKITTIDVQLFYSSKKLEASLSYYNSLYTNSIIRLPIPATPSVLTYYNSGELHTNGLEFEAKATVSSNIFVTGSFTLQNNADESTVVMYIPNYMGKIGAFYSFNKDLTVGVFNTLFGKPKENSGAKVNPEAKAVDLLSLNINYKLPVTLPLELTVYVQNLLNSDYYYPEFNRGWVNTLPVNGGTAVYATVGVRF